MAAKRVKAPDGADDLRARYQKGHRDFSGARLRKASLRGLDLREAVLHGADLRGADLEKANLWRADLRDAQLGGANLTHAKLHAADLRGASASEATLTGANLHGANIGAAFFLGADLRETDLNGAQLDGSNLASAKLHGADLRQSRLRGTELRFADLTDANLAQADLSGADFWRAHLAGANLKRASLSATSFVGANLDRADLGGAKLQGTHLVDVDLAAFCDAAPPVEHLGPSQVDYASIIRSLRSPNLQAFLQRTGMPEIFIEFMIPCARALDQPGVFAMLQSTFISYGSPDEAFARKLNDALHRNGVTTFFFPENAVPGERLHRTMRKGVNEHDRVVLVCSKASLDRNGVLNEIEETLARESRDGGASYLIPVRLDDYVFSGWKPTRGDIVQAVRDRVVADFTDADKDDEKFKRGLMKLVGALKRV